MKRPFKKWLTATFSAGILLITAGSVLVNANEKIYDDAEVSITSALDRYIANGATELVPGTDEPEAETKEHLAKAEGSIKEVAKATGDIVEVAAKTAGYADFEGKALVVSGDIINIRAEASADSRKVGTIRRNGIMIVEEKGDEWSLIASGSVEGYIKNEFLAFGDDAGRYAEENLSKMARITASSLRVRDCASEDGEILTLVPGGETYYILGQENGWTYIEVDDSVSGYVNNEFVEVTYNTVRAVAAEPENTAPTTEAEITENETAAPATEAPATEAPVQDTAPSGGATNVVDYALQFVGNPYVYGGSSLTNGTDCSGFTMSVYANFGYSLPHSSAAQSNCGTEVSLSALAPGDLVFYTNGGSSIGHVALYIGNGQVVHASTPNTGIIISSMNYSAACKAVRIIN